MPAQPPLTLTPRILPLVAEIGELVGAWSVAAGVGISPRLRRENRIRSIHGSLASAPPTDQVSDQVSDQVKSLLRCLKGGGAVTAAELMARLDLRHKPSFRKNYLNPALAAGLVEMTEPSSPRSPTQRYRLTNRALLFNPHQPES